MSVDFNANVPPQGTENKKNSHASSIVAGAGVGAAVGALVAKMKQTEGISADVLLDAGLTKDTLNLSSKISNFAEKYDKDLTRSAKRTIRIVNEKLVKSLKEARKLGEYADKAKEQVREDAIKMLENGTKNYGKNIITGAVVGAAALLVLQLLNKGKKEEGIELEANKEDKIQEHS
ncbi:MAG: hypothetical protein WCG23_04770 [bacterium]